MFLFRLDHMIIKLPGLIDYFSHLIIYVGTPNVDAYAYSLIHNGAQRIGKVQFRS